MSKKVKVILLIVAGLAVTAAVLLFLLLGPLKKEKPPAPAPGPEMKAGDIVSFGEYKGGTVEWLVLETDGEKAFLLSSCALECRTYHDRNEEVTWKTSELRKWMNSVMFNLMFSDEERARILTTTVLNEDNPEHGTPGGEETDDRMFLLSLGEVEKYLPSDADRICRATRYAKKQGVFTDAYSACYWWLRTPGSKSNKAACIGLEGNIGFPGAIVGGTDPVQRIITHEMIAVRPAMWITLEP